VEQGVTIHKEVFTALVVRATVASIERCAQVGILYPRALSSDITTAGRGVLMYLTIPSLSSQSERAKNTIHWFGIYSILL